MTAEPSSLPETRSADRPAMVVAIDGPAAAGKGTLARGLARQLGFAYLDSGSLYRAVGAKVLAEGGDPADDETAARVAEALQPADLERPDLRSEAVGRAASLVAAKPRVRAALLAFQRHFAASPPDGKAGAVLDGRDIGTVVCPDAPAKLFVDASVEIRARRRMEELRQTGADAIYAAVLADLKERDERDRNRAVAPLKPADDAELLDTTDLGIEEALETALRIVRRKTGLAVTKQA
ncbi:cytidylate kinase [Tistlia consotensis]|uniref:Cytidylate kinase n=1 Tax=Tistlia consotensis USBA 355 TaxID=560819 RepID=A0A1Y6BBN6_9PROT|nr:(d)CMP kinase [Tistlia consotensis]SME92526.1 cytidylate kinase [Tistlia consotensis USBA 355]SNR28085.1 cytidylate kinase [Tistlia consotensis]